MQFIAVVALLAGSALAGLIPALPGLPLPIPSSTPVVPGDNGATGFCSQNTTLSCCTSASGSTDILGNLLGGECELTDIVSIVDLNGECPGAGESFCCPSDDSGAIAIGLSCSPINLRR